MGEREDLRLITSEAELRVGMLVERRSCPECLRAHRFMLIGRLTGRFITRSGRTVDCAWRRAPLPVCARFPHCSLEIAIYERRLYEVRSRRDDEAEQDKQHRLDVQLAADMARARPAVRKERTR